MLFFITKHNLDENKKKIFDEYIIGYREQGLCMDCCSIEEEDIGGLDFQPYFDSFASDPNYVNHFAVHSSSDLIGLD